MLISKEAVPQKASMLSVGGAAITLAGTSFTAFAYGVGNFALRPEFYQRVSRATTTGCVQIVSADHRMASDAPSYPYFSLIGQTWFVQRGAPVANCILHLSGGGRADRKVDLTGRS